MREWLQKTKGGGAYNTAKNKLCITLEKNLIQKEKKEEK